MRRREWERGDRCVGRHGDRRRHRAVVGGKHAPNSGRAARLACEAAVQGANPVGPRRAQRVAYVARLRRRHVELRQRHRRRVDGAQEVGLDRLRGETLLLSAELPQPLRVRHLQRTHLVVPLRQRLAQHRRLALGGAQRAPHVFDGVVRLDVACLRVLLHHTQPRLRAERGRALLLDHAQVAAQLRLQLQHRHRLLPHLVAQVALQQYPLLPLLAQLRLAQLQLPLQLRRPQPLVLQQRLRRRQLLRGRAPLRARRQRRLQAPRAQLRGGAGGLGHVELAQHLDVLLVDQLHFAPDPAPPHRSQLRLQRRNPVVARSQLLAEAGISGGGGGGGGCRRVRVQLGGLRRCCRCRLRVEGGRRARYRRGEPYLRRVGGHAERGGGRGREAKDRGVNEEKRVCVCGGVLSMKYRYCSF
eukprot:Rhum_TRINITY_DN12999_c0_g1::Rhum_TRINITY_DN12999_c0_g1_i1::g.55974::m.55974